MKHFYYIAVFLLIFCIGTENTLNHQSCFSSAYAEQKHDKDNHADDAHADDAHQEQEKGSHGGKLFRQGDFSLELSIYEKNVAPQFRIYIFENNKAVPVENVDVIVTLTRLDKEVNIFKFTPQNDFLLGDADVTEPHSFDVEIHAIYKNKTYHWAFESYEGRTYIDNITAEKNGVKTEHATNQTINQYLPLTGRIVSNPNASAQIRARFSGIVKNIHVNWGETVTKGQALATIESNKSLTNYTITSPVNGIITQRNTNIGDITGNNILFVVSDYSSVWAQVNIFQDNLSMVKIGQSVKIKSLTGRFETIGKITMFLPKIDATSQTITAVIPINNSQNIWSPDMMITGNILINSKNVPVAVRISALQKFRDFTVVFEKFNTAYEVRMLELGLGDDEWIEVISGLKANTPYVTENSFLIKADIEKSGASHDH